MNSFAPRPNRSGGFERIRSPRPTRSSHTFVQGVEYSPSDEAIRFLRLASAIASDSSEIELDSSSTLIQLDSSSSIEVVTNVVATRLQDLIDFDASNQNDKYVMVYDASIQKYKLVNPDEVLNYAAGTETIQPGLVGYASTFLDRLDTDLDDKIDLDAGTLVFYKNNTSQGTAFKGF